MGRPISEPMMPETITMCSVCSSDFQSRSKSMSGDIAEHLRRQAGCSIKAIGALDCFRRCGVCNHQRAKRLACYVFDSAGKNVHGIADLVDQARGQRLKRGRAKEGQAN